MSAGQGEGDHGGTAAFPNGLSSVTLNGSKPLANAGAGDHEYQREACCIGEPPSGVLFVTTAKLLEEISGFIWKSVGTCGIVDCKNIGAFV